MPICLLYFLELFSTDLAKRQKNEETLTALGKKVEFCICDTKESYLPVT